MSRDVEGGETALRVGERRTTHTRNRQAHTLRYKLWNEPHVQFRADSELSISLHRGATVNEQSQSIRQAQTLPDTWLSSQGWRKSSYWSIKHGANGMLTTEGFRFSIQASMWFHCTITQGKLKVNYRGVKCQYTAPVWQMWSRRLLVISVISFTMCGLFQSTEIVLQMSLMSIC